MRFIECLDYKAITDLILQAKSRVFIAMPGVHEEVAVALTTRKEQSNVDIKVAIDAIEDHFRHGYGDFKAVEKLREAGIMVLDAPGNMVSFIITDDTGYFLFPESRIFSEEAKGTNGIAIDSVTLVRLESNFFPPKTKDEKEVLNDRLIDAMEETKFTANMIAQEIEKSEDRVPPTQELDEKKLGEVKDSLDANPPLDPDIRRQIDYYIAKVQYVEMNFVGANIQTAKVHIPSDALPFNDEEIKHLLETKMRMFTNLAEKEGFKPFLELKKSVDTIREQYLVPVGLRKKSVIKSARKKAFDKEITRLKELAQKLNDDLPEVLQREILDSKKRIRAELQRFLKENPPEALKKMKNPDLFDESVQDAVDKIVGKVRFPDPTTLAEKISLSALYFDFPFTDFNDAELLRELEEKGIMEKNDTASIVAIKQAFEAKKLE